MAEGDADGAKHVLIVFYFEQPEQNPYRLFWEGPIWDSQLSQDIPPEFPLLRTLASAKFTRGVKYLSSPAKMER